MNRSTVMRIIQEMEMDGVTQRRKKHLKRRVILAAKLHEVVRYLTKFGTLFLMVLGGNIWSLFKTLRTFVANII